VLKIDGRGIPQVKKGWSTCLRDALELEHEREEHAGHGVRKA
jgi:hypothetical protein